MTAIRRTRPAARPPRRVWARAAALPLLAAGLFGCGTATPPGSPPSPHALGANDPAWIALRTALPPPDTDRLNYDERTRTLTLYNLPGNDRWLVRLPGETAGRQVAPRHRIPDVDPAEVMVYYTRPGFQPSVPVSVKQILDSGSTHVSMAPR